MDNTFSWFLVLVNQKATELMLRSETILQSITDAIFTLDRTWHFTYLNPQAEKLLLKSSEELLGKLIWEEFPEAADSPFYINYTTALEQQVRVSFEEYFDPLQSWYQVTAYPYAEGLSVYFQDITKRKQVEFALQEQLRLAHLVAEVSQVLILEDSLQSILQQCAEALVKHLQVVFARIWTFNPAEKMLELQASAGKYTHLDGPHSRVPLGSFKIGQIALERQPHLTNDVANDSRVSDQEWVKREGLVAFAGYPLLIDDHLVGVLGLFSRSPISVAFYQTLETLVKQVSLGIERKLNESELREQREQYAVTLSSIGDAVITTDNQGRVTYLNPVAENLTAWPNAEALGQPLTSIFNIINMESRLPVENPVIKVLEQGIIIGMANHTSLLARDGREIPIEDSAAPIKAASGKIIGVVLVFRDATERLHSEEERHQLLLREQSARQAAEKALKERETFLSVAAHELKTPLTGLKGFTQVLTRQVERSESQPLDLARLKRNLGIINKQSDKLTYLIDQLLDVSRIEAGKLQLDQRATEVLSMVREVMEQVQSRTDRHTFILKAAEEKLVARVDPFRYEQVISNLLDNALKYSPAGGTIELILGKTPADDGSFTLSITDQGLGIPVERRAHIFERFYQAHDTNMVNGLGLGLFICREIIQLHGGEIRVEFPPEGGTRFIVTVPLGS